MRAILLVLIIPALLLAAWGSGSLHFEISGNNTVRQEYAVGIVAGDKLWTITRPPHSNDMHVWVNQGALATPLLRLTPVDEQPGCNARTAGTFATAATNPPGKRRVAVFCDGEQWRLLHATTPAGTWQ